MGSLRCVFLTAALALRQLFGACKPFGSQPEIWAARGEFEKQILRKRTQCYKETILPSDLEPEK